jgi:WD repeat-containing protein 35
LCSSQAFVKLEALPSIPKERREAYADLAMSIFQQYPPADPHSLTEAREHTSSSTQRKGKHRHGTTDDAGTEKDQVLLQEQSVGRQLGGWLGGWVGG